MTQPRLKTADDKAWDELWDICYDLEQEVEKLVKERFKDKPPVFQAMACTYIIEHLAELARYGVRLVIEEVTDEQESVPSAEGQTGEGGDEGRSQPD